MNLGKSVYNLLKRQPEVFVEGLGSFKRNHTPAAYDEKRNVYLPPISYIDFEPNSRQGYDFISYIQQLQLIDRAEAEAAVAFQVADLLQKVREGGQAKLDDLGFLVNYGDSYVFKALDLSGFQYTPVEAIAGKPMKEKAKEREEEERNVVVDAAPAVDEEQKDKEDGPAVVFEGAEVAGMGDVELQTSKRHTGWYVVTVLVALVVMVAIYLMNQSQPVEPQRLAAEPVADSLQDGKVVHSSLLDSLPVIDSVMEVNVSSGEQVIQKEELLVPESHRWQIVIGSHKTLAQAYEQAESYNKAGYPKVRVIPSNLAKNRKKVIWDSYVTKQEADSALRYVQKHHIRDAWPDEIRR